FFYFFLFTHSTTSFIYTLSLHDALPIFHAIGYLAGASVLNESHDSHASSQDAAYGAGWSLQMWIDLLAEGIKPERVKVLGIGGRSEEHTSELQSRGHLVCRLLLEKKNIE